jgi:hypothetical protein
LHDLRRDPASELVVEAHALVEHLAIKDPTQPHGEDQWMA